MGIDIHKMKEIYPGVFYSVLDMPDADIFLKLIDPDMAYVLCWENGVGNYTWQDFNLPITSPEKVEKVLARRIEFSFCCATEKFMTLLPNMEPSLKAVQLNAVPPKHFSIEQFPKKQTWRVLKECGWHVMIDIPGNDYGEVFSPYREVVEKAISIAESAD